MKTFKEGDRVSHKVYGVGAIVNPYGQTSYATVQFDNGDYVMADTSLLTPVLSAPAAKFKTGDRVHHAFHGSATVTDVDEALKLVTIQPTFYRGGERVRVHPISLTHEPEPTPIPEPQFTAQVMFTDGAGLNTYTPLPRVKVEAWLTQLPNWDTMESITITRVKG